MACARARATPNTQTKLRLFATSAGYCQRPECNCTLFCDGEGEDYHIAEMAYVLSVR